MADGKHGPSDQARTRAVFLTNSEGAIGAGTSQPLLDGRKVVTAAGTRVQFDPLECRQVAVTAELANTGVIVLGGATVVAAVGTRRGTPLSAGDTVVLSLDNMSLAWMDSTVSGEGVTFTVLA